MAKKDKTLSISCEHLSAGVEKCLKKAGGLASDAKILLKASSCLHSSILFSFALEEFGKAVLLRKALDHGSSPARIDGFFDHKTKLQTAADHFPLKSIQIVRGAFEASAFEPDAFQVDVIADLETRLKSLYVDWDEQSDAWLVPPAADKASLEESLDQFGRILAGKTAEWTKAG